MSLNPKTTYILKRAVIFFVLVFFLTPIIDIIGGDSLPKVIENKLSNPLKFILLTAFQFVIGLLIGWFGWKQNQKARS